MAPHNRNPTNQVVIPRIDLDASRGILILDVVGRTIAHVEVLNRVNQD